MFQRLLIILVVIVFSTNTKIQAQSDIWVGTWSCAPYAAGSNNTPPSPYLENNTLRQVIRASIGGETLRMKFSNKTCSTPVTMQSVNIAISKGGSSIDAATITELKFNGNSSVTMDPYSSIVSDIVEFSLKPSDRVAITIHYGQVSSAPDITSHVASRTDSYILEGDQSKSENFAGAKVTAHWFHINTIEVIAPSTAGCVGVIGNSITDGYGLSGGLQNRWTDIFSEELLKNTDTQDVGVLNLGIGATLVSGNGPTTGLSRYKEDLLKQSGMRWIIIFYGTNDIAYGGTTEGIINAYQTIINDAHTRNIKVYGATITPFKGSGHYSLQHEQMRQTVNEWIRTSGQFDDVIDFDEAIQDPNDPVKMLEQYANDWLHPNVEGYAFLGRSVDISLFTVRDNNFPLIADAGPDQELIDYEKTGFHSVTLDGSSSFAFGNEIASFEWSKDGNNIATGKMSTVNLPVGENTILLTVTDVNGETATDEVMITINESNGVWLEAECGAIGSLWDVKNHDLASNGQYITVRQGNNSTSNAPATSNGLATYTFDVEESGTYSLYARLICPSPNDDSFWIKVNENSFSMWNGITAPSWRWVKYPTDLALSEGTNTLTIGYREDGALIDKLWITNTPSDIYDEGGSANNCQSTSIKRNNSSFEVFPNPVSEHLFITYNQTPYNVNLYNSNGQKLLAIAETYARNSSINMSGYKNGVYFISIINKNTSITKKIIKI